MPFSCTLPLPPHSPQPSPTPPSQVLKDANSADSYGMADGDIIHIVTVSSPAGQASQAPASAAAAPAPAASAAFLPAPAPQPQQAAVDPFAALLGSMPAAPPAGANPFAAMMGGMGGMEMPDMASMQARLLR